MLAAEGSTAPRCVYVGDTRVPPEITHEPIRSAMPGAPLEVRAGVRAGAPLARVTLYYRNLNQMATHDQLPMLPLDADGTRHVVTATIPAAHVTREWDLMYHLEAVDVLGNATFFPGLVAGTPYIVVSVTRPDTLQR